MMQLFVTPFMIQGDSVIVENGAVLEQLTKVLRIRRGDKISIQYDKVASSKMQDASKGKMERYIITIDDWDHVKIYGTVVEKVAAPVTDDASVVLYVAMPNKWDKAELIAQKCSELGITKLVFWRAERSVLREENDKKVARIQKIMQEAVEQSWGWQMPALSFVMEKEWGIEDEMVIFDKVEGIKQKKENDQDNPRFLDSAMLRSKGHTGYTLDCHGRCTPSQGHSYGVVGPEGGLTEADYAHFPHHIVYSLGNTILRMETAAIVGSWVLKQGSLI